MFIRGRKEERFLKQQSGNVHENNGSAFRNLRQTAKAWGNSEV
jgi:hypothetical protein